MFLRQSTSQVFRIGPFVDSTDGVTPETGLTIANTDCDLSKDGAAFGSKNSGGLTADGSNGWYSGTLDTTDTNTVGELIIEVTVSGALPVWTRYYVVEEAIYDKFYASGAAVTDLTAAQVNAEVDTALADYDAPTKAELDSGLAGLNDLDAAGIRTATGLASANLDTQLAALPTAAENRAEMDSNSTQLTAIVADTNELQTDWTNGGRLDLILDATATASALATVDGNVDAILVDTSTSLPADIAAISSLDAAGVRSAIGLASANLDTQLGTIDTNVDAVLVDTGTTLPATLSTIDGNVDAILVDTGTTLPAAIPSVSDILTTQMTESYAADGVAPTLTQAVMLTQQILSEASAVSTTMTVRRLDGSATAATFTLNDDTTPTSITRAT